jgi:hypothetical protein
VGHAAVVLFFLKPVLECLYGTWSVLLLDLLSFA